MEHLISSHNLDFILFDRREHWFRHTKYKKKSNFQSYDRCCAMNDVPMQKLFANRLLHFLSLISISVIHLILLKEDCLMCIFQLETHSTKFNWSENWEFSFAIFFAVSLEYEEEENQLELFIDVFTWAKER